MTTSTDDALNAMRLRAMEAEACLDDAADKIAAAQAALERDRSTVASAYSAATKALDAYSHLIEGRGCYAWDDDRWKDEFRRASQQIRKALAPLDKVASDLTNCPKTTAAVQAARAPQTTNA